MKLRSALDVDAALVAGPAALAAGLCLYQLSGRSLGFDEAASVAIAAQHGATLRSAIAHDGGNMAGYYVLLHVLIDLFGDSEVVLRLPSALAAGVTTALICMIGLRLFERRVALVSGALSAVSLPLVFWGQSARSYALLVALITASFLAFVALLDGGRRRLAWFAYVLFTTLAIYASLMAVLIIPAQLAVLCLKRRRAWIVASALPAIAICCVPLVVLAARRGSGQLFWVSRPTFSAVKQVLESLTSAGLVPSIHATATTNLLLAASCLLLLAVAAATVAGLKALPATAEASPSARPWGPALVLAWLVVPVALALIESFVGPPIFVARNLLICLPAVGLLLGWGMTRARVPPLLGVAALAALIVLRALQLAPSYGVSPEDWRGATAYVLARAGPGDCIAFYPSDGRQAFEYYLPSKARPEAPRPVLPSRPFNRGGSYVEDYAVPSAARLAALTACRRLWFVSSHVGLPDGPSGSRRNYFKFLGLGAALQREFAHQSVRLFGYADAVRVELLEGR